MIVTLHSLGRKQASVALPTLSGCSSVGLEYASGGREVASSNLVTPTRRKREDESSFLTHPLAIFSNETLYQRMIRRTMNVNISRSPTIIIPHVFEIPFAFPTTSPGRDSFTSIVSLTA